MYQRYTSTASSQRPVVARSHSRRFSAGKALTRPDTQPAAPRSKLSSTRSSTPQNSEIAIAAGVLQVGDPADVLRRLLDRHQVWLVRQLDEHLRRDVHRIRDGVVVDHDLQVGRSRHGAEMERSSRAGPTCRPSPAKPSGHRPRSAGHRPRTGKRAAVVHSATPLSTGTRLADVVHRRGREPRASPHTRASNSRRPSPA